MRDKFNSALPFLAIVTKLFVKRDERSKKTEGIKLNFYHKRSGTFQPECKTKGEEENRL